MPVSRKHSNRTNVLLAMDWLDYGLNLGIAQYAREAGWIVDDLIVHTGIPPERWSGDGVIAMLNHPTGKLIPFVKSLTCPVVDLANEVDELKVSRVLLDDYQIGVTGAQHLLSCGLKHFAFFVVWDTVLERDRMRGFRETIERARRQFHLIDGFAKNNKSVTWEEFTTWIGKRLLELPRPIGVMAQHDRESSFVIHACESAGLAIPEDVAVLGCTNETLLCELGPVPLSSVDVREMFSLPSMGRFSFFAPCCSLGSGGGRRFRFG
jgi:LacI family transcriptional regulator